MVAAVDPYTRTVAWRTPADSYTSWQRPMVKPKLIETPTGIVAVPGELYFTVDDSLVANYVARVDAASGAILDYSNAKATGTATIVSAAVDWADGNPLSDVFVVTNKGAFAGHNLIKGYDTSTAIDPPDTWYISGKILSDGEGHLLVEVADADTSPTNTGVAILDTLHLTWSDVLVTGGYTAGVWCSDSWWIQTGNDELKEISTTCTLLDTVDLSADYSITDIILNGNSDAVHDGLVYDPIANDLLFQSSTKFYRLDLDNIATTPETITLAGSTLTFYHAETCRASYGPQTSINARSANLCAATGSVATLDAVVSDLSIDGTRLAAADIDVTDLSTIDVRGFAVSTPMARRNAIAMLQTAYLFDYVPRSGILTGILRGNTSSATLTEDEIGAHVDGGAAPEPWTITRGAGASLPDQVEITFADPDHNYEPSTQLARRQASTVGTVQRISLALALTNDEGAQVADTHLHLAHIASEQYKTNTMPSTIDDVQPAEVLTTTYDGVDYVYRVTDASIIDGRMIDMVGAREVPEVFTGYSVGGDPRTVNDEVTALGLTQLRPLDIPMLRNQDDNAGVYIAGASYTPGWPGADVQRSTDGVSYASVSTLTSAAAIGSALNAPTTGQANSVDLATTLNVSLMAGSLSSGTRAAPTYAAWGINGRFEVIAFITASQHADGYWQISDMVRGALDTGHAMGSHAIGDQFVVLDDSTLQRVLYSAASIDAVEYLRGVTFGKTAESATAVRFTFTAESLEPYAPCRLDGSQGGGGEWILDWERQDRTLARPLWSPQNSEAAESYTVEILDDEDAVVRTETVTDATTYEYGSGSQVTDFGRVQDGINFKVYQVSANTGNGHAVQGKFGTQYNYVTATIDKSPTLYVRFDETTGTAAESTVGVIDGTYTNTPTLGESPILPTGKAVALNGTNEYIEFNTYAAGYSTTWVKTIEISFNIDAMPGSGHDAILGTAPSGGYFGALYVLIGSDSKLYFRTYSTGGALRTDLSGATVSTGTDYHLIITFDYLSSSTMTMHLNGASYATTTAGGSFALNAGSTARMWVGRDPHGYTYFDGTVDDLVCYQDNLTSTEITDQFNRGGIA